MSEYHFADLTQLFQSTFDLTFPEDYVIQYFDVEKNRHVIQDETTFQAACALYAESDEGGCLRFIGQTKACAALYDATEPILKAIEKLLKQLNEVMQKVVQRAKTEDWEGKCRQRLNSAGEAIQRAAQGTKTSFNECKVKVQEYPYHELLQ